MMKKKSIIAALLLTVAVPAAVFGAIRSYGLLLLPAPGMWNTAGAGVAALKQVQVSGSAVANGTVVIQRVSPDLATTNDIATATCNGGSAVLDITNSVYIVEGDLLLRSGTATNGACRVIIAR